MYFIFYFVLAFVAIIGTDADVTDQLACESITCPVGSTICMFNKKSTDNLQNIAISVSCLTSNGTLLQNSDTMIPNPAPQKRTDVTSFTILDLNSSKERQQEFVKAVTEVIRKLLANLPLQGPAYPGLPGQYPGQSAYGGYQYPPGPVITITNSFPSPYGSSSYSSFMNRNACPNPPCINNLPPSPPTSRQPGSPNLMPSSLDAIYENILKMRQCMQDLEKAVQDASAPVPPPSYGPTNNVAFPVTIPYNANVFKK